MRAVKITLKTPKHRAWLWQITTRIGLLRIRSKTGFQLDLFNQVQ